VTSKAPPTDPELVRFLREELGEAGPCGGTWQYSGIIWLWRGKASDGAPTKAAWHFVTIEGAVAEALRAAAPGRSAAWGSVYVEATIGATQWRTSAFPSKEANGFLLPIKASVRKSERLAAGDTVTVSLAV
jgi:hypothetical protein